ncbi:endonuclease domain-containing protein [Sphingomonas sp. ATCC 31555]|uniref:endonuclease domain-containing protein n=1 Tax=Sphingomonas sp. ATCC 31555 TaxID=194867 RepID=UPI000A0636FC|nr:endonuclease domain-containing protein [Sphingomonas sp. ATCC 31555]
MRLGGPDNPRRNAKRLRKEMPPPEIALWLALRQNEAGLRFRKQHPAGPYVLDFYCAPAHLAIEVDGEAHARGHRPERDAARDAWLKAQGVRILRYTATDVLNHTEGVVRQILTIAIERRATLQTARLPPPPPPTAAPPPVGGG